LLPRLQASCQNQLQQGQGDRLNPVGVFLCNQSNVKLNQVLGWKYLRHVLEEFFHYITLMQWWHLLKSLWVSGEFSLLQHAPILRLQFQVNIFKISKRDSE